MADDAQAQRDVPRRVFESLFGVAGGIPPEGALRDELRAAGFDPDVKADDYPLRTWRAAIDIARRHVYPELPRAEGERTLARRFVDGFTTTPVGFVLKRVAPVFGLDRVLQTLPHYVRTVRSFMRLTVAQEGPGRYRILFEDPEPAPEFLAGCFEYILGMFRVTGEVTVVSVEADRFELRVHW